MCVEATSAFTVIMPSVGGVSMRIASYSHDLKFVLEPEVPVELAEELRLDLRERDAGRRYRELRDARLFDDVQERHVRVGENLVHRLFHVLAIHERHR